MVFFVQAEILVVLQIVSPASLTETFPLAYAEIEEWEAYLLEADLVGIAGAGQLEAVVGDRIRLASRPRGQRSCGLRDLDLNQGVLALSKSVYVGHNHFSFAKRLLTVE